MTIDDQQKAPKGTAENPTVVDDNISESIEVDTKGDSLLYTAQEIAQGITVKAEKEEDIATDLGDDSDQRFDYDLESTFDGEEDGDKDEEDENIK